MKQDNKIRKHRKTSHTLQKDRKEFGEGLGTAQGKAQLIWTLLVATAVAAVTFQQLFSSPDYRSSGVTGIYASDSASVSPPATRSARQEAIQEDREEDQHQTDLNQSGLRRMPSSQESL